MRCCIVGGETPFQTYLVPVHFACCASLWATLLHSLFKCLIYQRLKELKVCLIAEKLLGPLEGLLKWSSLTSQPIKHCYLCKYDIIGYFLFFIPYAD